jgi:hypothetical protein
MENNIPTAEEFLRGKPFSIESIHSNMIQFAKLHVEAALKVAAKSAKFSLESGKGEVHFDVYPLTNIK